MPRSNVSKKSAATVQNRTKSSHHVTKTKAKSSRQVALKKTKPSCLESQKKTKSRRQMEKLKTEPSRRPTQKKTISSHRVVKNELKSSRQKLQKKTKPSCSQTRNVSKQIRYPKTFTIDAEKLAKLSPDQLVSIGVPPGKVKGIKRCGWSEDAGRVVRLYDSNGWPKENYDRLHRRPPASGEDNDAAEDWPQDEIESVIDDQESNAEEVNQNETNLEVGVQNMEKTCDSNSSVKKRSSWFGNIFG